MAATYLDKIVAVHRERAAADTRIWSQRTVISSAPSLREAIKQHRMHGNAVIAEVKRKSPSKGWLNEHLDPAQVASDYVAGGATGISVLTDTPHFGGSFQDLSIVRGAVSAPILRKDFTVSINDVLDTAEIGASAVLLIAAALSLDELREFHHVALEIGLDALVEVHDVAEAERALSIGATFIGVNQRNLHTFSVDTERAEAVVDVLPSSVVAVAESGFSDPLKVARAAKAGFDAVLVGESFVTSGSMSAAVSQFVGHPIGSRD